MSTCTCPQAAPDATTREGDKECPEHGLEVLACELDGMSLYTFADGFKCFARTQVDADRCHARLRPVPS